MDEIRGIADAVSAEENSFIVQDLSSLLFVIWIRYRDAMLID